jgi:hypothetical protein
MLMMLCAAAGLGGCVPVPDVVSLEAVPTPKFSRDLAQCNADATNAAFWDNAAKRCMKAKGYRFLRQY